jgi:hypothetical protein
MSYNGHKNWNHWNVSLWINKDEPLYRQALALVRVHGRRRAAERFCADHDETPDGARYSVTSVMAAMREMT